MRRASPWRRLLAASGIAIAHEVAIANNAGLLVALSRGAANRTAMSTSARRKGQLGARPRDAAREEAKDARSSAIIDRPATLARAPFTPDGAGRTAPVVPPEFGLGRP